MTGAIATTKVMEAGWAYREMQPIPVLDKGFVRLDAVCADDLSVVNAARVSFHMHKDAMAEEDEKLIGYLMRNRHGTPFEHNFFRFHVKAPIFVFREWHRHRIGVSINEWSARYSELQPDFYIPAEENVRVQVGRPGQYTYEPASAEQSCRLREPLVMHCNRAYDNYQEAIRAGIAKEQARLHLPVNIYSEMYWSCNARSLMSFLALRNTSQAQWEIRQYAEALEQLFAIFMPITHAAFIINGNVAPKRERVAP